MTDPYVSDGAGPLPPPPASDLRPAARVRRRWPVVVAALIALPIVEIVLLILLGRTIGVWWTLVLLFAEAVLGAYLLKREGRRAWGAITDALQAGVPPTGELADAAFIFTGGVLFILPGLLTDVLGLLCLIPGTRRLLRGLTFRALGLQAVPRAGELRRHVPSGAGETIDGEVVEGTVEDPQPYRRGLDS